jgi:hypothetical protein
MEVNREHHALAALAREKEPLLSLGEQPVVPGAVLDAVLKRKSYPLPEIEPRFSSYSSRD